MFSLATLLCPWGFKSHSLDPKGLPVSPELWTSANGELEGGTLFLFPPAPHSLILNALLPARYPALFSLCLTTESGNTMYLA